MGKLVVEELQHRHPNVLSVWAYGQNVGSLDGADVIIDFSTPEGFTALMARATVPVVSGTTGVVLPKEPKVALLHSANFSLGVAVLANLVQQAKERLPDWDIEIVELHHNQKRDAPSGTALRLADGLGPKKVGRDGPRVPGEVGIHAVRGGDIVGEHHVYLCGPGERLQLAHIATNRRLFASGAVQCAEWVRYREPGLYDIGQVAAGW